MMSTKFIVLAAGAGALAVGQADALSLKRGFLGLNMLRNAVTGAGRGDPWADRRTTFGSGVTANQLNPGRYSVIYYNGKPGSGDRMDRSNPVVSSAVRYPRGTSVSAGSRRKPSSRARTPKGSWGSSSTDSTEVPQAPSSTDSTESSSASTDGSNPSRSPSPPGSVDGSETPTENWYVQRWSGSLKKKEDVNTTQAKLNAVADRFAVARQDNFVMQQLEQSATPRRYWGQQAPSKVSSNHVRNVGRSPRVDNGMRRLSEAEKQQQRRAEGAKAEAAALRQLDNARAKGLPLETTQALGWRAKQAASRRAGTDNIFITAQEKKILGIA